MGFSIRGFQKEAGEWTLRNFGEQEPWVPLVGATEELGELSHVFLKRFQGIRKIDDSVFAELAPDAIGDIIIYLANFCNLTGLDLEDAIKDTWDIVKLRDWKKNPDGTLT